MDGLLKPCQKVYHADRLGQMSEKKEKKKIRCYKREYKGRQVMDAAIRCKRGKQIMQAKD